MPVPHLTPAVRERFNVSRLAIKYPRLTVLFWIVLTAAGFVAAGSLKYALFPDITSPVVVVHATAPVDDAEQTEVGLTRPIEQAVRALPGTSDVTSTTYPGEVVINVPFDVGSDLEASRRTVEAALKPLTLPSGSRTEVLSINLNEAVVATYAIESSALSPERIGTLTTQEIVPMIKALPGVLEVYTLGDSSSANTPAAGTPSAAQRGATRVRMNGRAALAIQVIKRGDANTLDVADRVADAVKQLNASHGSATERVALTLAQTQSDYIRAATGQTLRALAEAVVISALVIFPFLWNWRAAAISALAIPTSLLGTAIVMALCGFNLETITLLALAMIVGNVVDDAIVDLENICRHIDMGKSPREAAISATDEIGLTVTAATLTVVAVFLPIGTMGGTLGQFFRPFGITISAAMLISLLVSRTLSPVLAVYWLEARDARTGHTTSSRHATPAAPPGALAVRYGRWLAWSLAHRWVVLGTSAVFFAGSLALIPLIPNGFIPKLDRGEFLLNYSAPPTARAEGSEASTVDSLRDSLAVAEKLDTFARQFPAVETTFTVVGTRQGEVNKGQIHVQLKPNRDTATAALQEEFRRKMPRLPGVSTSVEDIPFVEGSGEKPVQLRLVGDDLVALQDAGQSLAKRLNGVLGLTDISSSTAQMNGSTPLEIQHHNGRRVALITANLGPNSSVGEATDRAVAIAQTALPAGISLDLGGESAQAEEIIGSFLKTLGLSVLCIFVLLLVLFRSLLDTVVVIASLPLCIVGAMLGLLVTQADFGMVSLLGIIFLLGLTNKNAILIVDYIKQLRARGLSGREAILQGAPVRLRPILMTTAATVLGMLPLALGLGAGFELRVPMAIAIMGGLITSTLLSLLVVPVMYDSLASASGDDRSKKPQSNQ
jgi:multidrug efflux pump subunit AcrB